MPIKIGKWLSGIWKGISKIWHKANDEVKKLAPVAIAVVQNVKKFIDSPVADVITALIPGNVDDVLKEKLREKLPDIIIKMQLINAVAGMEDTNEQLRVILENLKLSADEAQNVFYHGLASLVLESLSDGKLSWSEATVIAEYYYTHIEKGGDEG